jgi:hypothetical protein
MKLEKILLLAAMALAASAFVVPATASAAVWLHEGVPVEEHVELDLTGAEVFQTPKGGMICNLQATLATNGGSTAEIAGVAFENEGCTGFGGLAKCTLIAAEATSSPWTVDVNAEDLTITSNDIRRTFDPECPVEELESKVAALKATPDNTGAIAELAFSGEGTAHFEASETTYTTFGSFILDEEDAGTYGIG